MKWDFLKFCKPLFNDAFLGFISNLLATIEFYAHEIMMIVLPSAAVYFNRASFSKRVEGILVNSNETVREISESLLQIGDILRRALKHDRTEEEMLHGLLVATYENEFKEKLFIDAPQPTDLEKEMTELAKLVRSQKLQEDKRLAAMNRLREALPQTRGHFNEKDEECSDEQLLDFFINNPQWRGQSSKPINEKTLIPTTSDGELRPLAAETVADERLIVALFIQEQSFNDAFPSDLFPSGKPPATFDALRKEFPVRFQHFLRVKPQDYELIHTWQENFQSKTSLFLQEFKKMKISGKAFEIWLKRFLNGDFDR